MGMLAGQNVQASDYASSAYDFETTNDTNTSTTYVDGTLHGVAFTAPTSGAVWIRWGGGLGSNATAVGSRAFMSIYVRTGSTIDAGSDVLLPDDDRAIRFHKQTTDVTFLYVPGSWQYLLTGLTPGSDYNVITQFRAVSNTAAVDNRWIAVEPAFI